MESKRGIKVYPLYLGDMHSDSNGTVWGDTMATVAEPNAPHRLGDAPSVAFLIDHPQVGYILYDTGMPDDPATAWPQFMLESVKFEKPEGTRMVEQLALVGIKPEDIKYVITSHMHMDHIGNDHLFAEKADFFVGKAEAEHAYSLVLGTNALSKIKPSARGYYIKKEVLQDRKSITYIDRDMELFPGIEVALCPGHTPGVLILIVHLDGGTLILTEDALNEQRNYDGVLPGGVYDSLGYRASIDKIHQLARKYEARVFFGHDAKQFAQMKKAPEFYA